MFPSGLLYDIKEKTRSLFSNKVRCYMPSLRRGSLGTLAASTRKGEELRETSCHKPWRNFTPGFEPVGIWFRCMLMLLNYVASCAPQTERPGPSFLALRILPSRGICLSNFYSDMVSHLSISPSPKVYLSHHIPPCSSMKLLQHQGFASLKYAVGFICVMSKPKNPRNPEASHQIPTLKLPQLQGFAILKWCWMLGSAEGLHHGAQWNGKTARLDGAVLERWSWSQPGWGMARGLTVWPENSRETSATLGQIDNRR